MIDIASLWIGDEICVVASGEVGTFEGKEGDQAKVKIDGKYRLLPASALMLYEGKEFDDLEGLLEEPVSLPKMKHKFGNTVDLHLEKMTHYSPGSGKSALDAQVAYCRQFIEDVIRRRLVTATIIHGKGEGILRQNILHLIGDFKEIRYHTPRNNEGALELLFIYHRGA